MVHPSEARTAVNVVHVLLLFGAILCVPNKNVIHLPRVVSREYNNRWITDGVLIAL